jgi:ferritin-like metal-binding protein YciE
MALDQSIHSIEERLEQLKERVERARKETELELRSTRMLVEFHTEKARNVANEALAEIRHLTEQLRELTSAANTTTSPETHRATARLRRRGSRA